MFILFKYFEINSPILIYFCV